MRGAIYRPSPYNPKPSTRRKGLKLCLWASRLQGFGGGGVGDDTEIYRGVGAKGSTGVDHLEPP